MRNTFNVLFYIKKNAPLRNGNAPIMGRITINGERTQFSTRLSVAPEHWDVGMGRVAGRSNAAGRINEQLSNIHYHIERCYNKLFYEQSFVTPLMVKEMYFGANLRQETVLAFFRQHNEEFNRMVGISRSKTTYYKYRCVCKHLANYIWDKYDRKDLMFKELNREFLTGFHAYIAKEAGYKKNTTWIYMIALKHILMLARSKGYMGKDLFANYKLQSEFVTRNYLTMEEITRMMQYESEDLTLQLVRDTFLFSCFTGLSYVDIRDLEPQNIQEINKQLKYMPASGSGRIFELPSNGWCNKCLDKIVAEAGIQKKITFHAARHTFATTITLSQGVAIETISKLLGHKNIRTTQIYANITHSHISSEMERLSKRINLLCPDWTPSDMPNASKRLS